MNYIINPAWFYWLGVADGLREALILTAIIGGVIVICATIATGVQAGMMADYPGDDEEIKKFNIAKKALFRSVVAFALVIVLLSFIPSKETLIEMQIARFATVENANWTLETIKSAVDYIVEAIGGMK